MTYKDLKTYQQATVIYDFTVKFTEKYIKSYRTKEQMDHAARSGKQNIAEGSEVSRTSKKSEIKLLGVAHASLCELAEDYEDYLRQNNLPIWTKESTEALKARNLVYTRTSKTGMTGNDYPSYQSYASYLNSAEQAANAMLCLINQTTYLLKRQIAKLEQDFLEKGGFTENLYKERKAYLESKKAFGEN